MECLTEKNRIVYKTTTPIAVSSHKLVRAQTKVHLARSDIVTIISWTAYCEALLYRLIRNRRLLISEGPTVIIWRKGERRSILIGHPGDVVRNDRLFCHQLEVIFGGLYFAVTINPHITF